MMMALLNSFILVQKQATFISFSNPAKFSKGRTMKGVDFAI